MLKDCQNKIFGGHGSFRLSSGGEQRKQEHKPKDYAEIK